MSNLINWVKAHKIISIVIILAAIVIGVMSGGDNKSPATVTSSNTKTAAPAGKASATKGQAKFAAVLLNTANNDNTSMTLPAAGWDANDGWDTATGYQTQLNEVQNGQNGNAADGSTVILPAVIALDAKTLQVDVNVHNTGTASGTATCTIKASSVTGSNPDAGKYYGVSSKTITALNGGDIQPDSYGNVQDKLTISNQGARYIKQITVQC